MMYCFFCKKRIEKYRRLNHSRIRFIRKVYSNFDENTDKMCVKCFEKFEKIFRSKKKSKVNSSSISVESNVTLKTISSKSSSKTKSSKDSTTDRREISSKENTQSNGSPPLRFLSQSLTAASEDSTDSTDRIVRNTKEIPSLRDSSKVSRNADVTVAREGAEAAERSALRRKRTREVDYFQTPAGRTSNVAPAIDDDDAFEIPSDIASSDLALVGPIVKRRKEPVIHLNQDVMDIYLANTSGG